MRVSERKVFDYFWQTEYFFEKFLKKCFNEDYMIKYSLEGNGIIYLVKVNGAIYQIKYTQARKLVENDDRVADSNKQFIINTICANLKNKEKCTISQGKFLTFPVASFIGKVEIIKKRKIPN